MLTVTGAPIIYCCGKQTRAIRQGDGWRYYWCSKRVLVVWPL